MKHIFIVNPAAGKYDHTQEYTEVIDRVCAERRLDYEIRQSAAPGDCRSLAHRAAAGGEDVRLYACGGDGTLNEVVNGAAGFPNVSVTHFPGGSGNDFIKIFSETEPFHHLERLMDPDEAEFDLIRCNDTYSLNILSIGLDARIGTEISRYKRIPLVTGHGAYLISTAVNFCKGLSARFSVSIDGGEPVEADETMICICNGRWYGGGFNPVPEAEPDDGLLDVLLVGKVGVLQAASVIGRYKQGLWRELPGIITHHRCRVVRIRCEKPSVVNVDGEAIWTDDAKIEVVPRAVRFFYPKGLTYHSKINTFDTNSRKNPLDISADPAII